MNFEQQESHSVHDRTVCTIAYAHIWKVSIEA